MKNHTHTPHSYLSENHVHQSQFKTRGAAVEDNQEKNKVFQSNKILTSVFNTCITLPKFLHQIWSSLSDHHFVKFQIYHTLDVQLYQHFIPTVIPTLSTQLIYPSYVQSDIK